MELGCRSDDQMRNRVDVDGVISAERVQPAGIAAECHRGEAVLTVPSMAFRLAGGGHRSSMSAAEVVRCAQIP